MAKKKHSVPANAAETKPPGIVAFIQLRKSKTMAGPINKQRIVGTKHYWVAIGTNNECLSTSEVYETLQSCKQTAYQVADQLCVPVKFFKRVL